MTEVISSPPCNSLTLVRPPKDWARSYTEATFLVINRQNYLSFIL
jgi:hypothetical protein